MGLDSVELLVKAEKTFNITISDHEAQEIVTVGDFHNAVWHKIEYKNDLQCNSQLLFYKIRQYFVDKFNYTKSDFSLDKSLNEILPKKNRKEIYAHFSKETSLKLPNLVLDKFWSSFLEYFGFSTIIVGFIISMVLIYYFSFSKWFFLLPIFGIILTIFISKLLNPKRIVVKPEILREFIEHILSKNFEILNQKNGISKKEMESIMNHLIADSAGLELKEISSEKRICYDLGIN